MSLARLADACRESRPRLAVVLGSGMGEVVERWGRIASVPFADIPGLVPSSIAGHRGAISLVKISSRPVLVVEGRLHFYEGNPWDRVVQPTRIVASLGATSILHTNAAGGIRDDLVPGTLMPIVDHIELTRPNWWEQRDARRSPYSPRLLDILERSGLVRPRGIYASLTGPSYETPAEIRAVRSWGADAVGMSTAREVSAGVRLGLECAAVSCITNRAAGLSAMPLSHKEVVEVALTQRDKIAMLIEVFSAACGLAQTR